jgi:hypothetical protein
MLTPPPAPDAAAAETAVNGTCTLVPDGRVPSVVVRQLAREEWDRLDGVPFLPKDAQGNTLVPNPDLSVCLIAEQDGEIIGFWSALYVPHCEGFWISPDYRRKTRLIPRLLAGMRQLLADCSIPATFCFAESPDVADYCARVGMTEVPVRTFLFETNPCPSQPPSFPPASDSSPTS